MDSKYRSRKFLLACFFSIISAAGLFSEYLTGELWIAATGLILGLYGGSNVAQTVGTRKSNAE